MHYASDKFNITVGPDIGPQILAANVGPQKCGPQMLARKYWPTNFGPQILARKYWTRKFWPAKMWPAKMWPANVGLQKCGPQILARKCWPAARSPHSSHSQIATRVPLLFIQLMVWKWFKGTNCPWKRHVGSAILTWLHITDYHNFWNNERWKSFDSLFTII